MHRIFALFALVALSAGAARAGDWTQLLNGRNLEGWESVGDGVWTIMADGTLVGQRDLAPALKRQPFMDSPGPYRDWLYRQAWLYTTRDFGEFDLHLDYWLRFRGPIGLQLHDRFSVMMFRDIRIRELGK